MGWASTAVGCECGCRRGGGGGALTHPSASSAPHRRKESNERRVARSHTPPTCVAWAAVFARAASETELNAPVGGQGPEEEEPRGAR